MIRCAEVDRILCEGLDDLDSDAIPRHPAASDGISRKDLQCLAIHIANIAAGKPSRPVIALVRLFLEAAIDAQQHCLSLRARVTAQHSLVEVGAPRSIGS